ncbi:MAG: hypothetical protein ACSHYF_03600 [Verrucomicrobiaceae bacterium]
MKKLLLFLCAASLASAQTPPTGVSSNQDFALFNGGNLQPASLSDYEGKIVILMLLTPW